MSSGTAPAQGQVTKFIYSFIRDGEWDMALEHLTACLQQKPDSRAALSLAGYCYYSKGDYEQAVGIYERLTALFPGHEPYQLNLANARLKAEMYLEAATVRGDSHEAKVIRAYAKRETDNIAALQQVVDELTRQPTDDHRVYCLKGNLLVARGNYPEAIEQYQAAYELEKDPRILYAKALAHFREINYVDCLDTLAELLDLSRKLYPDFMGQCEQYAQNPEAGMAAAATGAFRCTPNLLLSTSVVEAYNLRFATHWVLQSRDEAEEDLHCLPPRTMEDLDQITLHNIALFEMETNPSEAVSKLQHLITQPPFPMEAFCNLITIYVQHGLFDMAADLLAANSSLALATLDPDKIQFFEAVTATNSEEDSFNKLQAIISRYHYHLKSIREDISAKQDQQKVRKSEQRMSAPRGNFSAATMKKLSPEELQINTLIQQYNQKLSIFVPCVFWQAGILYGMGRYKAALHILDQYTDLLGDSRDYILNKAHIFFASENYEDATEGYDILVQGVAPQNILEIPAVALANLCVGLILLGRNKDAETLMHMVDQAEAAAWSDDAAGPADGPGGLPEGRAPPLHLCVINLVIGTLYCVKGNTTFGVTRVLKALEPIQQRLSPDTWLYCKRPLLALAEYCAMSLGGPVDESIIDSVIVFLDDVIRYGKDMSVMAAQVHFEVKVRPTSIAEEARELKALFLGFM